MLLGIMVNYVRLVSVTLRSKRFRTALSTEKITLFSMHEEDPLSPILQGKGHLWPTPFFHDRARKKYFLGKILKQKRILIHLLRKCIFIFKYLLPGYNNRHTSYCTVQWSALNSKAAESFRVAKPIWEMEIRFLRFICSVGCAWRLGPSLFYGQVVESLLWPMAWRLCCLFCPIVDRATSFMTIGGLKFSDQQRNPVIFSDQ